MACKRCREYNKDVAIESAAALEPILLRVGMAWGTGKLEAVRGQPRRRPPIDCEMRCPKCGAVYQLTFQDGRGSLSPTQASTVTLASRLLGLFGRST